MKTHFLSIIIASYNAENTIKACIQSLKSQITNIDYEIIFVDSSSDNTTEIVKDISPEIKIYNFPERIYPGDARNIGIRKAHGDIVVFTDTDCIVASNWLAEIVKAHQTYPQQPIIGGAVDNFENGYIGWAAYFCDFYPWAPQEKHMFMDMIPTCTLTMRKELFSKYGYFKEGVYSSDTEFYWRMKQDNIKPLFIPTIQIKHINNTSCKKFFQKQKERGTHFAKVRGQSFSKWQRIFYITLSPILPLVLLLHQLKHFRQKPKYRIAWLKVFPLVVLGMICWSYGEFCGYIASGRINNE